MPIPAIHSVTVGSYDAEFACSDPLANINLGSSSNDAQDCHRHLELKRKLYSALQEGDDGELAVGIPRDVSLKYSGSIASLGMPSESALP